MKISPYTLQFHSQKLSGVLLESAGAYSLVQPWESLGDADLATHLADLRGLRQLPLTQRALQLMEIEAQAKRDGVSLVPPVVPASHVLLNSAAQIPAEVAAGVKTFKIKIGKDIAADLALLKQVESHLDLTFRLRLDVNQQWSRVQAFQFFAQLSERLLCAIDFVEDPLHGTPEDWIAFSENFNLRLAHDFAPPAFKHAAEIWIQKPSREDPWPAVEAAAFDLHRIVVTTALDHPLGHVIAAWEAARIQAEHPLLIEDCGLLSFENLLPAAPFRRQGSQLDLGALTGPGFGMDAYLKTLEWKSL